MSLNINTNYRFGLDKSPRKFVCPSCGRRTFVRYVDRWANRYLDDPLVGRCDRSSKCGYHLPPRKAGIHADKDRIPPPVLPPQDPDRADIPHTLPIDLSPFFSHRKESAFYRFLLSICPDKKRLEEVALAYCLGANRTGGVIYWQKDLSGAVRTGKIMHYDPQSGKRLHSKPPQWVHNKVSKPQDWQLRQCPFGLHLLAHEKEKSVAIVESEKTAVIMSIFAPELLWLALGGKENLNQRLLSQIPRSTLFLYPDKDAFCRWQTLSQELQPLTRQTLIPVPWHLSFPSLPPSADPADAIKERF